MAMSDRTINAFLDDLAGSSATPGGGSAAALAGAMGASLVNMVCRLTIGKRRFASDEAELRGVLDEAEGLRRKLAGLADADSQAFDRVMAAYRLPKETQPEQASRQAAIQEALQHAADVPLETASACAQVVNLAHQVVAKINPSAVSDAGAAVLLAEAALQAARLNVAINLSSIEDARFVGETRQSLQDAMGGIAEAKEDVLKYVLEHTKGT
jgi:formiminotetrahydrofolate cyclodeaminase